MRKNSITPNTLSTSHLLEDMVFKYLSSCACALVTLDRVSSMFSSIRMAISPCKQSCNIVCEHVWRAFHTDQCSMEQSSIWSPQLVITAWNDQWYCRNCFCNWTMPASCFPPQKMVGLQSLHFFFLFSTSQPLQRLAFFSPKPLFNNPHPPQLTCCETISDSLLKIPPSSTIVDSTFCSASARLDMYVSWGADSVSCCCCCCRKLGTGADCCCCCCCRKGACEDEGSVLLLPYCTCKHM